MYREIAMASAPKLVPHLEVEPSVGFMQPTLPSLDEVMEVYRDVYRGGVISNGQLVERLERALAERLRVGHCVAVSSCTSGLILLMKTLGLRGEVILPAFTSFATGEAILWNGLTPVFADCQADTWNIDPIDVTHRLTPLTAAILGVHMYGNPVEVRSLQTIAKDARVKLLFDAAHAFGSSLSGRPIGGFGDAEVFSLAPTKILVAGEGGIITTNDAALALRLRAARNCGDLGAYNPVLCGLNARMSEFHAALALNGLAMVEEKVKRHNKIAAEYQRLLAGIPGVSFQSVRHRNVSNYKDFSIHLTSSLCGWAAQDLCTALKRRGVPTKRCFQPPLHKQKIFAGLHTRFDRPLFVAEWISEGIVSLPIYPSLRNEDVHSIAGTIREVLHAR